MTYTLKNILSTALISDVMDELGYISQMLSVQIKPNFCEAKIFGYARTLLLKQIEPNEDYRTIYDGLPFIETINKGEIIVVGGGSKKYAFFGELMSTLSQTREVEGAIIDGLTRDSSQTREMRFPVFSRDSYARDIKKRGIIAAKDATIYIDNVKIDKGYLIVGDSDGVIVVPKNIEEKVITLAIKSSKLEDRIKIAIKSGITVKEIIQHNGEF